LTLDFNTFDLAVPFLNLLIFALDVAHLASMP
jgi:hypothetical protein